MKLENLLENIATTKKVMTKIDSVNDFIIQNKPLVEKGILDENSVIDILKRQLDDIKQELKGTDLPVTIAFIDNLEKLLLDDSKVDLKKDQTNIVPLPTVPDGVKLLPMVEEDESVYVPVGHESVIVEPESEEYIPESSEYEEEPEEEESSSW